MLAAETRSFQRAVIALEEAEVFTSAKTVERIVHEVGQELVEQRDDPNLAPLHTPEHIPPLAIVECDGGRIRTREPGHGPGVHQSGKGWKETKNGCLIRAARTPFAQDPQPDPPRCFLDPQHVARIAETEALSVAAPLEKEVAVDDRDEPLVPAEDYRPRRRVRTVLSSMANSAEFGRQLEREARRRLFFQAPGRAFLGDGLSWNWSIWEQHFGTFEPILDFIHVLSYLYESARSVGDSADQIWEQYVSWMSRCWAGEVSEVLAELRTWQQRLGDPPEDCSATDPREVVRKAVGYLANNQERMDYPRYRQAGYPVTTAWMESLVKEVNYRVKGTEMFWNNPQGAEAILQIRAASLCEDQRLKKYLNSRPGSPFTRRSTTSRLSP